MGIDMNKAKRYAEAAKRELSVLNEVELPTMIRLLDRVIKYNGAPAAVINAGDNALLKSFMDREGKIIGNIDKMWEEFTKQKELGLPSLKDLKKEFESGRSTAGDRS
jgi:hypothetical protein